MAVTLRIAEHIASGINDIDRLAGASRANADALGRVLRHLVDRGIFEEPSPGAFVLNEPARSLTDPALRLGLDLEGIGGRMAHSWSTLLTAVRTGNPAYHEVFGSSFWEDLDSHPEVSASFDELMGLVGHGVPDPDVLIDADDWDSVATVVDVGGGTGALLAEILRARPHVRGVLVDRPRTVARSADVFRTARVSDRITAVGQSFFDPLPSGADLYLLKSVLSDWPDREAAAILRRCAEAAAPNGRVAVLNGVSPDDERQHPDLLMLVLVGGRQRRLSEFRALAGTAGLVVHRAERQSSGRFIVECRAL